MPAVSSTVLIASVSIFLSGARISVGDGTLTILAKNQSIMDKVQEKVFLPCSLLKLLLYIFKSLLFLYVGIVYFVVALYTNDNFLLIPCVI